MGEDADRLVTVEMRSRGTNRGIVRRIHDAARKEAGGRPITARAAEAPFDQTGAGCAPEVPHGESDGPPRGRRPAARRSGARGRAAVCEAVIGAAMAASEARLVPPIAAPSAPAPPAA
jgi:hypothetical protein